MIITYDYCCCRRRNKNVLLWWVKEKAEANVNNAKGNFTFTGSFFRVGLRIVTKEERQDERYSKRCYFSFTTFTRNSVMVGHENIMAMANCLNMKWIIFFGESGGSSRIFKAESFAKNEDGWWCKQSEHIWEAYGGRTHKNGYLTERNCITFYCHSSLIYYHITWRDAICWWRQKCNFVGLVWCILGLLFWWWDNRQLSASAKSTL